MAGRGPFDVDAVATIATVPAWLSPLLAVLTFLVVFGALVGTAYALMRRGALPFDRRGRARRGRLDLPLSSGSCAAAHPVNVHLDTASAGALAAQALDRVGATGVAALDLWTVAGWEPMSWRSWGQQVGVIVQPVAPGELTLWCCSRPMLASTQIDFGASQRSADRLAEELTRLLPVAVG